MNPTPAGMTKEEILLELQNIWQYMNDQDAHYGFGQISDLIDKLEKEQENEEEHNRRNRK